MAESETGSLSQIRVRVIMSLALIALAYDEVNPVKVICSIVNISTWWIVVVAILYIGAVVYSNAADLCYFLIVTFFRSLLSIFFSSIEVLGRQNIPEHGPIIFTGNHMNQFVDAAVILSQTPHKVGFLVAEKSFHKRIIGDFARAAGSIPVARPQDFAKRGPGEVMITSDGKVHGKETTFLSWKKGDKFRPGKSATAYRLKEVISDVEAVVAEEIGENPVTSEPLEVWMSYDILAAIDQSRMFETVESELSKGKCLGIFPEGGSHDRTDLLPLKVGVAAIAFGVLDKYDKNVPIVPVGLNYFRGHRFRGRVVVEFGTPIFIDKDTLTQYRNSRRDGYQALLSKVEDGMRNVIVTAPDYGELKLIHTVRRVWQKSPSAMMPSNPTKYRQDLARRFSSGYQLLKKKYNGEENLPKDILDLKQKFEDYEHTLEEWGLRDYQVNQLDVPFQQLLATFLHAFFVILFSAIPTLVLNAPVGLVASWWARQEAKKDLEASRVKLAARDVLMSKKVYFSLIAVPLLWITYAILLMTFTNLEKRTVIVLFLACPFFSYIGVTGLGMGIVDFKDLRPALLRLLPAFKRICKRLPETRLQLQKEVRVLVRKYGPELGSIYYDKLGWEKGADKLLKSSPNASVVNLVSDKEVIRTEPSSSEIESSSVKAEIEEYSFSTGVTASLPSDEDDRVQESKKSQ